VSADGNNEIVVGLSPQSQTWPAGVELISRLDRLLHRLPGDHAIDRIAHDSLKLRRWDELQREAPFDVVIDCSGGLCAPPAGDRILTPLFDGVPSELGAMSAILDGRSVEVAVCEQGRTPSSTVARPALSNRDCLTEALDNVISRMIDVIKGEVARPSGELSPLAPNAQALRAGAPNGQLLPRRIAVAGLHNMMRILAGKIRRKLSRTVASRERWALALRVCPGPGLPNDWAVGGHATYRLHMDDGRRFFADPFLVTRAGKTYVLCEEFPFATQRGIISAGEVRPDGTVGDMVPVLERPYHLSYPFVFEDGGEMWMIPEAAAGNGVELYRAVNFPWQWEPVARLIENIPACDATILHHGGIYWMFLTSPSRQSTSWDNLRLYFARELLGPWTEHATSPILIDKQVSRPAGAIIRTSRGLIRPAQDCSEIYGGGIILSRIDRLSEDGYEQTVVGEIQPLGPVGVTGTHTYSKVAGFEALDVWGDLDRIHEVRLGCRPLRSAQSESHRNAEAAAAPNGPLGNFRLS
jgi:hypothetical protein